MGSLFNFCKSSKTAYRPSTFLDQSDVKPKAIMNGLHAFSCAYRQLRLVSSSDWYNALFVSVVID